MAAKTAFKEIASRVNPDQIEQEVLAYWEEEKVFQKSLALRKDKNKRFTFYDGPPYATGKPHYGHVLQSALKDTVLRYKTMRGYHVPRRVGWDTHGLPVEVLVEKELNLKTKRDVLDYGIKAFNQKCREVVFRYIDEFTTTIKRLGRWADYDNAYTTLNRDYMESEWWVFKELWDKGLIYKDFRSTPYCIRCATPLSNFEVSMAYKDKEDETVYVKLPVADQKLSLLVWTTTPWTLPANVAVAFSSSVEYIKAQIGDEEFILAKNRVATVLGDNAKIIGPVSHDELASMTYQPPFPEMAQALGGDMPPYSLVPGDHVTDEDGTGLVHMAPAFGEEDALTGKEHQLPTLRTVRTDGTFEEALPLVGGKNIFVANAELIAELKQRGVLVKKEKYTHSYPFCWRCDEPLIYYALDTWFVKVSECKPNMLVANEQVNWIPEHIKHGRFGKGIESAPDWAVSRNRFWSVPLPIWECDNCDERTCVGSVAELQQLSKASDQQVEDLHRPYVDELSWACTMCSGQMKRVEEVLDVWFDSGSMPYAQWHYPFENKEMVEGGFPADFIVESIEMTRAWFYVLHVLAVALKGQPAYKNVIGSGIIFGEDGNKLSKKIKNYPEIDPTIEKYGADTVRMFFLSSTLGEPYVFVEKELQQLHRNLYQRLWNVYSFFVRYANVANWRPPIGNTLTVTNVLDQWILSRAAQLEHDVITAVDAYRVDYAARLFDVYIDDLSNWYVRRSRDRFQPSTGLAGSQRARSSPGQDAIALHTLHTVLVRLSKVLAPFMPFVTEEIYRNLVGPADQGDARDSVHLESLLDPAPISSEQQNLIGSMIRARDAASVGLARRAAAGIKVRQPLAKLKVPGEALAPELAELIKDEVNVKEVTFDASAKEAVLDTDITPELKSEGLAREIIRHGQVLRREAGYELNDRITLIVKTDDAELAAALENHHQMIIDALQADKLTDAGPKDVGADVKINDGEIHIGVVINGI